MLDINIILPLIKDFGLPLVALYYLFRLYVKSLDSNKVREDRYHEVIERHSKSCTLLSEKLSLLTDQLQEDFRVRQELLLKLFDVASKK